MFCKNNDGVCDVCKEVFESETIAGNVNGDGNINAANHALLKKIIAGLYT
jgi:hypothetical protein